MAEVRLAPLADLCDEIRYGVNTRALKQGEAGPKFLRITDIVPDRIDWHSVPTCQVSTQELEKFKLREGDIVVARTGATAGYAKLIRQLPEQSVFASYLVRFRIGDDADPTYVGHIVESDAYKKFVIAHAGGAAQPNANARVLGSFPVPVPDIKTQQRIGAVLSALDELIEINERRIKLLEDLACSLYREWFVHFRFPDTDRKHRKMLELPDGWAKMRLKDVANRFRESAKPHEQPSAIFEHFSIPAFDARGLPVFENGESIRSGKYKVEGESVLLSKINPKIPRVWHACPTAGNAVASTEFLIYRGTQVSNAWLWCLFMDKTFRGNLVGGASGTSTSHQRISPQQVDDHFVPLATKEVRDAFDELAEPALDQIVSLRKMIARLSEARDLLLPRLVTGKLDISDIDLGVLEPKEAA